MTCSVTTNCDSAEDAILLLRANRYRAMVSIAAQDIKEAMKYYQINKDAEQVILRLLSEIE
jgi:hypothetical protein